MPRTRTAGCPTDNAFLRAAHQANLAEIALSQDARKNATTACVKDVAAELERDHAKLDADVKALSDKLGVDLPLAPTAHQQQMLADVMAQKGTAAYDRAWLKTQDTVHRLTLKAIDHQVARGENRQITAAAKAARPVVAGHLERVEGGTCHGTAPARTIHAGSGGQAATVFAAGVPRRRRRAGRRARRGTGRGRRLLDGVPAAPQRPPLSGGTQWYASADRSTPPAPRRSGLARWVGRAALAFGAGRLARAVRLRAGRAHRHPGPGTSRGGGTRERPAAPGAVPSPPAAGAASPAGSAA